jgi:DNA repair protein RadC
MTEIPSRNESVRTDTADRIRAFPVQEIIRLLRQLSLPGTDPVMRSGILKAAGCPSELLEMSPYEIAGYLKAHPRAAALFLMVLEISACRLCNYYSLPKSLASFRETARLFMRHYLFRPYEQLTAAACNERRKLIDDIFVSGRGKAVSVSASTGDIIRYAVNSGASAVIIAHNHPVSLPIPSQEDILATEQIANILRSLDITLADHIIISGTQAYSMRLSGEYSRIFGSERFYKDSSDSVCTFSITD